MSGPWEKYGGAKESDGPWAKYKAPDQPQAQAPQPDSASNIWGGAPELREALSSSRPIWNTLGVPAQLANRGLNSIASAIPGAEPTGNKFRDIALNIPKVGAETLAEAAPGFVSRGSMLTGIGAPILGGLGKAAGAMGPGVAGQLESLGGMKPGLLAKEFNDPSLLFARIPQAARDAYKALNPALAESKMVSETPGPLQLVRKAMQGAKAGTLKPEEGFAARKAIDQLWKSRQITEDYKNIARKTLDAVAKQNESIGTADRAFSRGSDAMGLRQILPQNKYGGTSAFKTAIMAALNAMGPMGKVGMAAMSPIAMGAGAGALGVGAKALSPLANNPRLAVAVQQVIQNLIQKNQSQGQQP